MKLSQVLFSICNITLKEAWRGGWSRYPVSMDNKSNTVQQLFPFFYFFVIHSWLDVGIQQYMAMVRNIYVVRAYTFTIHGSRFHSHLIISNVRLWHWYVLNMWINVATSYFLVRLTCATLWWLTAVSLFDSFSCVAVMYVHVVRSIKATWVARVCNQQLLIKTAFLCWLLE